MTGTEPTRDGQGKMRDPALKWPKLAFSDPEITAGNLPGPGGLWGVWGQQYSMGNKFTTARAQVK